MEILLFFEVPGKFWGSGSSSLQIDYCILFAMYGNCCHNSHGRNAQGVQLKLNSIIIFPVYVYLKALVVCATAATPECDLRGHQVFEGALFESSCPQPMTTAFPQDCENLETLVLAAAFRGKLLHTVHVSVQCSDMDSRHTSLTCRCGHMLATCCPRSYGCS